MGEQEEEALDLPGVVIVALVDMDWVVSKNTNGEVLVDTSTCCTKTHLQRFATG